MAKFILICMLVLGGVYSARADTLHDVKRNGYVRCGVEHMPGFAYKDRKGGWVGFDTEVCRAIAVAVLGDRDRVRFADISLERGTRALKEGRLDVLARAPQNILSQISGDTRVAAVSYHDGVGIMVPSVMGIRTIVELDGAKVCALSTTRSAMARRSAAKGLKFRVLRVDTHDELRRQYARENCDAAIAPIATLAAMRTTLDNPGRHDILHTSFGRFPMGPLVHADDHRWQQVVAASLHAMIWLEEQGISQNAGGNKKQHRQHIRNLTGDAGKAMGLSESWAARILFQVGNYGDVFDRAVGQGSPIKLRRGLNALWFRKGMLNAPPME